MSELTLVVLAAGMGSRYGGLKQLDGVGPHGEVIMEYSIYDAMRAGVNRVVFVIRESFQEAFETTLLSRLPSGLETHLAFQNIDDLPSTFAQDLDLSEREKPWGTGHAVWAARKKTDGPFLAINADDYYGRDAFSSLVSQLSATSNPPPCMVGFRLANTLSPSGTVSRGICQVGDDGALLGIQERTRLRANSHDSVTDEPTGLSFSPTSLVSMNCWGFGPDFMDYLGQDFGHFLRQLHSGQVDPVTCEFYLPAAVDRWRASTDLPVSVLPSEETWLGVTYPEDKEAVVRGISERISQGFYPESLWS